MKEYECDEHPGTLCCCGIRVGTLQVRRGLLCSVDERGRCYYRATRRADALLAQRVVATMAAAGDDTSQQLVADLVSLREEEGS